MIPLKLQIKNFLSYGADVQTIEFGNYPLICLSGKNGHGKSALLDAITWSIWGQARKLSGNAKADQGLLRLGQTQMMVCLDFVCAGQQYRIRREYMQTYGKPVCILDFGLLDSAGDKFVSLTEKTIRDTQHKIDLTLRLTFDAFINSAFLRQGQANEFSKKSPKERKDVLASILGLDQYETIRKLAGEKIKQTNVYKLHLHTLNEKLEQELNTAPLITQKLTLLEDSYKKITDQELQITQKQKSLDADFEQLQIVKQERAMLEYQQHQLIIEQTNLQQQLKELFKQWRMINALNSSTVSYTDIEQQKNECLAQIKKHQQNLQDQLILKQEFLTLKETNARICQDFHEKQTTAINTKKIAIERLIAEKNHLHSALNETIAKQKRIELEKNAYKKEWEHYSQKPLIDQQIQKNNEQQFEKRKEHYQQWIAQANIISANLATLEQKNKLVHDEESPSCPLCEQNLSASRKRFLKKKFDDDGMLARQRLNRLSLLIKKLKVLLITQHAHLEEIKQQAHDSQLTALKILELNNAIQKQKLEAAECQAQQIKYEELHAIVMNAIATEQKSLEQLLTKSKEELLHNLEYQNVQKSLIELEKKLEQNSYNQPAHEQTMNALTLLEKKLEQQKNIQEQILLQGQKADQIHTLIAHLKKSKETIIQLNSKILEFKALDSKEKELQARHHELVLTKETITKDKEALLQEKGSLENQKNKLEQITLEHAHHQKELSMCSQTIDDYQAIASATGKDGIQALLIEDAIPEIEHETNELLSKLTDNQTQLFIESLRDLKKGGTKETLDIKISDAAGIRPYELFSGGEAFRIDFALRIAISKLLARRAGTSLQTLIIDEGFGSQDEEGLSNIMDALYKIQDDFAKIIIVSHLSSMKNQFPVHFSIEKGPHGSIVEILEQG